MFQYEFKPKVTLVVMGDDDEAAGENAEKVIGAIRDAVSKARNGESGKSLLVSSVESPKSGALVGSVNPVCVEALAQQLSLGLPV
jgi:hypothetical protein